MAKPFIVPPLPAVSTKQSHPVVPFGLFVSPVDTVINVTLHPPPVKTEPTGHVAVQNAEKSSVTGPQVTIVGVPSAGP